MLTMREKKALTREVVQRYQTAARREKSALLTEFVATTHYNRSYARRVLRLAQTRDLRRKKKLVRKGAKHYAGETVEFLKKYWATASGINY